MDEDVAEIIDRYITTRDMARRYLGAQYTEKMIELGGLVKRVSAQTGLSLIATGAEIARTADANGESYTAMMVMAATVELVSPTPADELRGAA